jgi:hypothetical protein
MTRPDDHGQDEAPRRAVDDAASLAAVAAIFRRAFERGLLSPAELRDPHGHLDRRDHTTKTNAQPDNLPGAT